MAGWTSSVRPVQRLHPAKRHRLVARRFSQAASQAASVAAAEVIPKPSIFLSHDWGVDEFNRSNHERVRHINHLLKERGFTTWLDEEMLESSIVDQISEGIENAQIVVVFMTQQYYNKVNGDDSSDYCRLEFNYALRRLGDANMVACVMEPRMRDSRKWEGPIGIGIGGSLYVDMSDDSELEASVNRLADLIRGRLAEVDSSLPAEVDGNMSASLDLIPGDYVAGPSQDAAGQGQVPPAASWGPWPRKPTTFSQAIFLSLVAFAAAIYYFLEGFFLSFSSLWASFVSFAAIAEDGLVAVWQALLAIFSSS